jgi:4-diphosphocytidyl-2-C-methyl-D-erythritol kinase
LPISVEQWQPGFGGNDLETVAAARYPVIAEHLACLSSFAPARMSGSGACVFAEFEGREQAEAALRKIPAKLRAWVAAGLAAHPLRELASE